MVVCWDKENVGRFFGCFLTLSSDKYLDKDGPKLINYL